MGFVASETETEESSRIALSIEREADHWVPAGVSVVVEGSRPEGQRRNGTAKNGAHRRATAGSSCRHWRCSRPSCAELEGQKQLVARRMQAAGGKKKKKKGRLWSGGEASTMTRGGGRQSWLGDLRDTSSMGQTISAEAGS